jgi:aminoglycoside 3-N-acetyltransferase I
VQIRRLRVGDRDLARRLFAVMADVFEEPREQLSDDYVDDLLAREAFWAIAALAGDEVVGGLTAHSLPMTRTESAEVFMYDVAVRADRQRQGIGRQLVTALCAAATDAGFGDVFVPVDSADEHALDFYRALAGVPAPVTIFTFSPGSKVSRRA